MRILQVGIGITGDNISACRPIYLGFHKNKHKIDSFEYRLISKQTSIIDMNVKLLNTSKNYDILIIGKGELIIPETLRKIKEKNNNLKIIYWYGDQRDVLVDFVVNLLEHVDLFLHTSGGKRLKEYYDIGKPKMAANFIIPTDVDLFGVDVKDRTKNIIFTGRDYKTEGLLRKEIKKYLKTRNDSYLYGSTLPNIGKIDYINALKSSKIGVNINDMQKYDKTTSNRLSHYLSCGVLGLTYHSPNIDEIFIENEDVVYFNNLDEFIEKLNFYLHNDIERIRISENGRNKMFEEFNSKIITNDILEILYNKKSKFDWIEIHGK